MPVLETTDWALVFTSDIAQKPSSVPASAERVFPHQLCLTLPRAAVFPWITSSRASTASTLRADASVKVADASLYPVLFRDYLVTVWPEIGSGIAGNIFIAAITLAITALNYVGLSIVGWVAPRMQTLKSFMYVRHCTAVQTMQQ